MSETTIERDEDWRRARRRLLVQAASQIEQRTLAANVIGTLLIVAATQALPNAEQFHLPMLLRFIAVYGTAMLYTEIRRRLREDAEKLVPLGLTAAMATFGGASWASLLVPLFLEPHLHPVSYIVTSGVFIGVSLVLANTAAIPCIALSFAAGFVATFLAALAFAPPNTGIWLAGGLAFVATGIGAFSIGSARQRIEAADTELENKRLSERLEGALARAEFLADRDPLTGLLNRRALFEHRVPFTAPDEPYHVLLIDLDNFTEVNERFGQETGDRILMGVALVLRNFIHDMEGEGHLAARLGGEELAVVLAVADKDAADRVTEQLHLAINAVAAGLGLPPTVGTASIGIASVKRGEPITAGLQRADNALYHAKRDGRDRVVREAA